MATRKKATELTAPTGALTVDIDSAASLHLDGWLNVISGIGVDGVDKRTAGTFRRGRGGISGGSWATGGTMFDRDMLDELYHGDGISARIIDLPIKEQLREWIEIGGDDENLMGAALQSVNARAAFREAMTWAALHGGSVMLLGINDGAGDMKEPLNEAGIRSFDWVTVLDRWDIEIVKSYDDPLAPRFGEPELYEIRSTTAPIMGIGNTLKTYGKQVHESRVIRFDGSQTSTRRRRENRGWCLSMLERSYDVVRDFMAGYAGASYLLQDFSQGVYKMKNLQATLAQNQDGKVIQRLRLLNYCRSVLRMMPLDADGEDFERKSTPVAGLPELLDRLGTLLSATTGIPITLLLGEAPGGLNATGDSDHRNWYNTVRSEQESVLRPKLSRFIQLLAMARGIAPSDEDAGTFNFTFRPLWQPSEKEIADTRFVMAQADQIYLMAGVVDPDEIRNSRFSGDKYSLETTLDREEPQALPTDPIVDPNAPVDELATKAKDPKAADPSTAFNGAQVTAMKDIVLAVAKGEIPRDSGVAMLVTAFPVDEKGAEAIMGSAGKGFEPKQAPVPAAFAGQQPPATTKEAPTTQQEKDGAP